MKKEQIYLSGSSFSIAQKCPASLALKFSKKLMAERQDAQEGTDAHEVIAEDIESMRRFLPEKTKHLEEHIEDRLEMTYRSFKLSGGIDYYALDFKDGALHVTDWKTGPMGIDHLGPAQIEFYAFLILTGISKEKLKKIKSVVLSLVSPRLNQKKTFTRTVFEILEQKEKFNLILKSLAKKEKPQTGEHCRWCSKRFVCPQLRDEMKRFADPEIYGKSLVKITAEDLKTLSVAAAVITDVRKYVVELLENGQVIPGVRIEMQNAGRIFSEGVDEFMLAKTLGTAPENLTDKKMKSPAALEKAGYNLDPLAEFISLTQRKVLKVETEEKTKKTVTTKRGKK